MMGLSFHSLNYVSTYKMGFLMNGIESRIKQVQQAFNRTQKGMAEEIEIHINSLKNYQAGNTTPDAAVLERVCRKYGVSPGWLLLGEDQMLPEGKAPAEGLYHAEMNWLDSSFAELKVGLRKRMRGANWVCRQIQAMDRSDELLDKMKGIGTDPAVLEEITAARRGIEAIEGEVLAAFFSAEGVDVDKLPEFETGGIPSTRRRKRGRKLVPSTITERESNADEGQENVELSAPLISEEFDEAVKKYRSTWQKLLERDFEEI